MKLKLITTMICDACLAGEGEECHTPGCILWLHRVDLAFDPHLYDVIKEFDVYEPPQDKKATSIPAPKISDPVPTEKP